MLLVPLGKAGEERCAEIGPAVAVDVFRIKDLGGAGDEHALLPGQHACREAKVVKERGGLVVVAVAVGVFQELDPAAVATLAVVAERIVAHLHHPELQIGPPGDGDGIPDERLGGDEFHLHGGMHADLIKRTGGRLRRHGRSRRGRGRADGVERDAPHVGQFALERPFHPHLQPRPARGDFQRAHRFPFERRPAAGLADLPGERGFAHADAEAVAGEIVGDRPFEPHLVFDSLRRLDLPGDVVGRLLPPCDAGVVGVDADRLAEKPGRVGKEHDSADLIRRGRPRAVALHLPQRGLGGRRGWRAGGQHDEKQDQSTGANHEHFLFLHTESRSNMLRMIRSTTWLPAARP